MEKEKLSDSALSFFIVLANLYRFGVYAFVIGGMYTLIVLIYPSFGLTFLSFYSILMLASYFMDSYNLMWSITRSKL